MPFLDVPELALVLPLCAATAACDRGGSEPTGTAQSSATVAASAPVPVAEPSPPPSTTGSCPAGRWEYDYSDQFLESLTRNTPGARVVREKGKVTCTFPSADRGAYICEVSEGGVENVFEADSAGGRLEITVTMAGRSTTNYETVGPNRWRTTEGDMSTLTLETKAKMGNVTIPMPPFRLFQTSDSGSTVFEWRCEGDTLKLKPEIAGMDSDWAHLKRL